MTLVWAGVNTVTTVTTFRSGATVQRSFRGGGPKLWRCLFVVEIWSGLSLSFPRPLSSSGRKPWSRIVFLTTASEATFARICVVTSELSATPFSSGVTKCDNTEYSEHSIRRKETEESSLLLLLVFRLRSTKNYPTRLVVTVTASLNVRCCNVVKTRKNPGWMQMSINNSH